jgi:hypothetical protein
MQTIPFRPRQMPGLVYVREHENWQESDGYGLLKHQTMAPSSDPLLTTSFLFI